MTTETFYRTSPIKRERRTKADIEVIKQGLLSVLAESNPMTVRQVFYQMTSRGYVPKTEAAYKGIICRLLADIRLDGTIPFSYIADNTRWMRKPRTFNDADEALKLNIETYRRAMWLHMPVYVEIWMEKDALAGIVYDITEKWDVPLMVTRGYSSLSFLYESARTIREQKKPAYIYYLGDYDPSGLDIARAVEEKLRRFAQGAEIHFQRIGVNEKQIEMWNLPTRPTKQTDTRTRNFNSDTSVELDAIPPRDLRDLVEFNIVRHVDMEQYYELRKIEKLERESLYWVTSRFKVNGDQVEINGMPGGEGANGLFKVIDDNNAQQ